jgi:hypothetical protein
MRALARAVWLRRRLLSAVLASALMLWADGAWAAVVKHDVVAFTDTTSTNLGPNVGAGISFSGFGVFAAGEIPVLGDGGHVAFLGGLTLGGSVTTANDTGLWIAGGGAAGPALIGRESITNPAGVPATQTFQTFRTPSVNGSGALLFRATLGGTGANNTNEEGVWLSGAGGAGLQLIAREGTTGAAPGPGLGGDAVFNTFYGPIVNDAGVVLLPAQVRGTGVTGNNSEGLWSNVGGSFANIARSGTTYVGLPVGTTVGSFRAQPQLNAGGTILFMASLQGSVNATNDSAIFSRSPAGTLTMLARTGSGGPGPNLGAGVDFASFDEAFTPVLNDAGTAAFRAGLVGSGVDTTNNTAVFVKPNGGATTAVARSGSNAALGPQPVLGADAQFLYFLEPVLNESNDVAFIGKLTGVGVAAGNDSSIWVAGNAGGDPLRLVAREGSETYGPGLGPGVTFGEFSDGNRPLIDDDGDVAWLGTLSGSGITTSNDTGLFVSAGGVTNVIAREGDKLDVDPGPGVDLRTVSGLGFYATDINDRGRAGAFRGGDGLIAFRASFLDGGSGIFTARVVPEPSAAAAAAVGLAVASLMPRRRRL